MRSPGVWRHGSWHGLLALIGQTGCTFEDWGRRCLVDATPLSHRPPPTHQCRNLSPRIPCTFCCLRFTEHHPLSVWPPQRGAPNISCKGPDSKYCRLCRTLGSLSQLLTALPLGGGSSHGEYMNERAWLCSSETPFITPVT